MTRIITRLLSNLNGYNVTSGTFTKRKVIESLVQVMLVRVFAYILFIESNIGLVFPFTECVCL